MGGEGAMMAANQSLKSNRSMLRKRREKSFSFVSNSTEKTAYNLPEISEKDILLLRKKLQKEQKERRIKQVVFLGVVMMVLIYTFIYLFI
ncbi:hypothetical protein [Olleya sp. HaHaR_3_96]|uniref:hypothetical protein n=1 Tax=Olleya sp. HaHaR_3_96 TaxID=2745560 RepID=UPI001C500652|nr:hypothetical protein [Olleya sp. HaHaR_3_96]QXP61180.1 hypothetical protein H0I26_05990 [Olleya sp. HaHaR_3_96]